MPITLGSQGGNIYDAAGPYLNAQIKASDRIVDYDVAFRQMEAQRQRAAQEAQAQRDSNAMNIALANQRSQDAQQMATQRDEQEAAILQQQEGIQARRDERQQQEMFQRGEQEQEYVRQNATQREAFDIEEKTTAMVNDAQQRGMTFSQEQQKEINDLTTANNKVQADNIKYDVKLRQQADLATKRKLSAIVPNEQVQTNQQGVDKSRHVDENTGALYKRVLSSQGETWERDVDASGQKQGMNYSARNKEIRSLEADIRTRMNPVDQPLFKDDAAVKAQVVKEYQDDEKNWVKRMGLDPHPIFEAEQQQVQIQQQQAEMQQQQVEIKRLENLRGLIKNLITERDPLTNEPRRAEDNAVMNAVVEQFLQEEKSLRDKYSQQQSSPDQQEADDIRRRQPFVPQGPIDPRGNSQSQIPVQQQSGMDGSLQARSGESVPSQQQPPILSSKAQLPKAVTEQLKSLPGGVELQAIREKHNSNSGDDQHVRMAVDIVLNAMMTKDTSDPDFAEAQYILQRAGFKVGN